MPEYIRSDNGPEFVAKDLRKWPTDTGAKTLYIELGSPWETGFCESFNSELRDEFLNGEIFYSLKEVQVLAERWRVHYNTIRPHSSLGYHSPAPEAWVPDNNLTGRGEPPPAAIQVHRKLRYTAESNWYKRSGTPGVGTCDKPKDVDIRTRSAGNEQQRIDH